MSLAIASASFFSDAVEFAARAFAMVNGPTVTGMYFLSSAYRRSRLCASGVAATCSRRAASRCARATSLFITDGFAHFGSRTVLLGPCSLEHTANASIEVSGLVSHLNTFPNSPLSDVSEDAFSWASPLLPRVA